RRVEAGVPLDPERMPRIGQIAQPEQRGLRTRADCRLSEKIVEPGGREIQPRVHEGEIVVGDVEEAVPTRRVLVPGFRVSIPTVPDQRAGRAKGRLHDYGRVTRAPGHGVLPATATSCHDWRPLHCDL